ncbi:hypothetical protein TIFTF001_018872 [Ficus carica]|uniref:Disease resistance N-terminal domain-containing protein n=1 Tax=Ficus carica TaxID=3494 RepID=A0AA88D8B8_FICCA|nr:hypothetical protein TIFTF001_018872 [Ficus carica]
MELGFVAAGILNKIAFLSNRDHWLPPGFLEDFSKLRSRIYLIRALLVDEEEKRVYKLCNQDWLNRLEDELEDVDDLVAEFDAEILRRSGG